MSMHDWPYPRWIAHRGAGLSAPENTLAAFQFGFDSGFRMFECDAKLSADGIVFLMHDSTLDRTTNAQGATHTCIWDELSQLDAGSWHSEWFAGSGIPTLEDVARFCIEKDCQLNIEIKPSPGFEFVTGEQVAQSASRLWANQPLPPLLTSFKRESLQGALSAAPALPRGLLMHELTSDWCEAIHTLQCVALACHYPLYDEALVKESHQLGLHCMAYTVNDTNTVQALLKMGVDTIITDNMSFGKAR